MSEANNNVTSFSSESNSEFMPINDLSSPSNCEPAAEKSPEDSQSESKMNWQKVAHKLREYNRKLLKQVFRLKQELAEVTNSFEKYVEKSQNSDLLVAQQESDLQNYQQQIAVLTQHLTSSQQTIKEHEAGIEELSEKYQLSQQQTARLERDCTLLQEKYSQNGYELIAKEKENKELKVKLERQQRYALQYKAELKHNRERTIIPPQKTAIETRDRYSTTRSIQPWSTPANSEFKIALPKTKQQAVLSDKDTASHNNIASKPNGNPLEQRITGRSSETIKAAAQIATWSASQAQDRQKTKTANKPKSTKVKPKSLAAVDLPTFPRPM